MKYKSKYELRNLLKKGDYTLFVFLIFMSVSSFYVISQSKSEGEFVTVTVNGTEHYHGLLKFDHRVIVQGPIGMTIVDIKRSKAKIVHSDCPMKICVKSGTVHRQGEMIVCVPNRVLVQIHGKHEDHFDVITK